MLFLAQGRHLTVSGQVKFQLVQVKQICESISRQPSIRLAVCLRPRPPSRLAFLAACSHPSVTMLGLEGAMPLSLQIINAMSTLSPNLTTLSLSFSDNDLPGPAEAPMYGAAVHHLMFALGGRLQQLQLLHVHDWPLSAFVGLRHACTALTKLEIMAGDEQRDADILEGGRRREKAGAGLCHGDNVVHGTDRSAFCRAAVSRQEAASSLGSAVWLGMV